MINRHIFFGPPHSMEHPVLRPLYQLLEPLLRLERQIHVLQTILENWTELHDQLEDANLPDIANDLHRIIFNVQDLMAHLRVERNQVAIRILCTILINPEVWTRHFVAN